MLLSKIYGHKNTIFHVDFQIPFQIYHIIYIYCLHRFYVSSINQNDFYNNYYSTTYILLPHIMRCSPKIALRKSLRVKGIYEYESIYSAVILYCAVFTSNLAAFHVVIQYAKTIRVTAQYRSLHVKSAKTLVVTKPVRWCAAEFVAQSSRSVGGRVHGEEDVCCFYLKKIFSIQCK